jgi:hypothetical protein
MTKGRAYTLTSESFEMDFVYGRTISNKVLSEKGELICNLKTLKKEKARINAKK